MTGFVRVKDKANGNEFTVTDRARHLSQERYEVLDEPAVDQSGRPRPPKYPTKTPLASGGGQASKAATTEAKKEAKES